MIRPRKAVEQLKKYRPPMEGRAGKLRLDFNENTVGCAPEVVRALRRALTPEMLTRYPEYGQSRQTLAEYFGLKPEEMLLTNGTDDAIKVICDAFVDPGDVLLVPAPTFPVYEFFHKVAGGAVERVRYDERFHLPVGTVVAAINKKTRGSLSAAPIIPRGRRFPSLNYGRSWTRAPDVLILVDEAYFDYSGHTVLPWIRKYENLLVSRTFSKAFGLAALRMGFIFGNPELVELLHRAQNPFQVNSLALAAASVAIRHEEHVKKFVATSPHQPRARLSVARIAGDSLRPQLCEFHSDPRGGTGAGNRPTPARGGDSSARLELRPESAGLLALHHRLRCSDAPLAGRT